MTLVSPPFLVDFGVAYLDELPEHAGNIADMVAESDKIEQFGADWIRVSAVLSELESKYGIYLLDVNPANIRLQR